MRTHGMMPDSPIASVGKNALSIAVSKRYAADIAHENLQQGDLLSLCTMFMRDSWHMDITNNGTYSSFLYGSLFTPFMMQVTEMNFWERERSI